MTCPNDQTQMLAGVLLGNGQVWTEKIDFLNKLFNKLYGSKQVKAWYCPKCGEIRLQAETR